MDVKELLEQAVRDAEKMDKSTHPVRDLFSTSERNITSYLRETLSSLIKLDSSLSGYQPDTEYNRVGLGDVVKGAKVGNRIGIG